MDGKQDPYIPPRRTSRPPVLRDGAPFTPRFDSRTGQPLSPTIGQVDGSLGLVPQRRARPFSRRTLLRDLTLVALHLGVYGIVIGGILYQLQFIGAGSVAFGSSFDAIFWPGWVWGTLIAAQIGAAIFQRRRWTGAMLGAMASVLLGSWILGQIDNYVVTAIVFRSVAVALIALTIAISVLRRPPAILTAPPAAAPIPAGPVPVLDQSRRPGLVSIPSVFLGLFALVFVLAAIAHGSYRALEVRGSGVAAERTVGVAPFTGIDAEGVGNVVVHAGDQPSVTVSGDDNLLDYVDVISSGGVLSVRFDPGSRGPVRLGNELTYTVTAPSLESLSLRDDIGVTLDPDLPITSLRIVASDNAYVRLDSPAADSVSVALRDQASVDLSGRSELLAIDAGDESLVDARELVIGDVSATVWGAASVRLGSADSLDYRQSGLASISCDQMLAISATSEAAMPQCNGVRRRSP